MKSSYWEKYYQKPLDEIPWQRTQADWFKHAVDGGKIKGKSALDLGCGTGMKSIYLAKNGFKKITGVDLSESAINYAKQNAIENKADDKCEFKVGDICDLSFLGKQKFDFILDWAALHCIDPSEWRKYVEQILEHSRPGTLFMLRVFGQINEKNFFIDEVGGSTSKVHLFNEKEIVDLFSNYFDIIESNTSKPRVKDGLVFLEFLMETK